MARWDQPAAAHIPLLREAGVTAVLLENADEGFAAACRQAGLKTATASELKLGDWAALAADPAPAAVLTDGLWPGVSRGESQGRDEENAGASRSVWVDSNGYWVACLKTLNPSRPAVLGYRPDEKAGVKPGRVLPFDSLELALVEARVNGGNFVLSVEPGLRKALLAGEEKARQAWAQLGATAGWLEKNSGLFGHPGMPMITALVDGKPETVELVNLMYRHNVSPALAPAANPPDPQPDKLLVLSASSIAAPEPKVRDRILAHALWGATVVVDEPGEKAWWRSASLKPVKEEEDRTFYSLGKGRLLAYKETIVDPGEYALDLVDLISHRRRAVRLWNAPAVIARATVPPGQGKVVVTMINYGMAGRRWEFPMHVFGHYRSGVLLQPGAGPADLKPAKRGLLSELLLPNFRRVGVAVLS